jgi:two-component system, NarL family, invasion response regulator UvrY
MKEKIKVHVADDHMVLIEGIIAMVNTDDAIEVIGYSQTGTKVLEWFKDNKADVLILDVNMPEKDGIEVLKSLNAKDQKPKIIMLSSFDDIRFVKELTTFGADGFVAKTSAGDHIIKAIKSVYNGQSYFNDEVKEGLFNLFVGQDVPKGQRPNEEAILL